jgi:hypothetical protein
VPRHRIKRPAQGVLADGNRFDGAALGSNASSARGSMPVA